MRVPGSTASPVNDKSLLLTAALLALALAGWMVRHPFLGIIHDNVLYALQALRYNDPATFGGDLFFRYGSQDSFTLFSPLYAGLIRLLGLAAATKALVMLGQLLWMIAAAALTRAIVPKPFTALALLIVATSGTIYGGNFLFGVGEGFVTPRLFCEALSLGSLAAFLAARHGLMAVLLILAALLHPLMVPAPAATILLAVLFRRAAWWAPVLTVLLGTLLVLAALAFARAAGLPFPAAIDAEWKFIAGARSSQLLIGNWSSVDWPPFGTDMVLVLLASLLATPPVRLLLLAAASVASAGIVLSYVGFDLLDTLLIGQVQPWRAIWLLRILAPIGMGLIIRDACLRGTAQRGVLLALCYGVCLLGALASSAGVPSLGFSAAVLLALVFLADRYRQDEASFLRLVRIVAAVALAVIAAAVAFMFSGIFSPAGIARDPTLATYSHRELVMIFMPAAVLALGLLLFRGGRGRANAAWMAVALVVLALAAASWDNRNDWRRYMDGAPDIAAALKRPIAPSDTVYWPGNGVAVWTGLGRQNYFTPPQGSGAIFNRDTAIEFLRRLRSVLDFEAGAGWLTALLGPAAPPVDGSEFPSRAPSPSDLAALCARTFHPDVIVLKDEIAGVPHEVWTPAVGQPYAAPVSTADGARVFEKRTVSTFFVYRCQDLHASSASP